MLKNLHKLFNFIIVNGKCAELSSELHSDEVYWEEVTLMSSEIENKHLSDPFYLFFLGNIDASGCVWRYNLITGKNYIQHIFLSGFENLLIETSKYVRCNRP